MKVAHSHLQCPYLFWSPHPQRLAIAKPSAMLHVRVHAQVLEHDDLCVGRAAMLSRSTIAKYGWTGHGETREFKGSARMSRERDARALMRPEMALLVSARAETAKNAPLQYGRLSATPVALLLKFRTRPSLDQWAASPPQPKWMPESIWARPHLNGQVGLPPGRS